MKKYTAFLLLLIVLLACKKQSGKYCPLMIQERNARHLVDLAPVSGLPQIMDTLNKYPQLQAYKVHFEWVHDPGKYYAYARCNVYYKDLILFDYTHSINVDNYDSPPLFPHKPFPININISTNPAIGAEQANQIAEETIHFKHCQQSILGLSNKGNDSIPDFRLVWRIAGTDGGYPLVEIDAQTGDVYRFTDGVIYD